MDDCQICIEVVDLGKDPLLVVEDMIVDLC